MQVLVCERTHTCVLRVDGGDCGGEAGQVRALAGGRAEEPGVLWEQQAGEGEGAEGATGWQGGSQGQAEGGSQAEVSGGGRTVWEGQQPPGPELPTQPPEPAPCPDAARHLGEPDEPKLLGQDGVVVEADRGPDGLVDGAVAEVHLRGAQLQVRGGDYGVDSELHRSDLECRGRAHFCHMQFLQVCPERRKAHASLWPKAHLSTDTVSERTHSPVTPGLGRWWERLSQRGAGGAVRASERACAGTAQHAHCGLSVKEDVCGHAREQVCLWARGTESGRWGQPRGPGPVLRPSLTQNHPHP